MLYLIDGYNVTMADPATAGLDKEGQRDALVRRLAVRARTLLGAGEIVVVFDARGQLGCTSERVSGVKVVFAPDADTEIVHRAAAARGQVTVVSGDRRLSARISQDVARSVVYREASAVFEDAKDVIGKGRRSHVAPLDEDRPPNAGDITRELEAIWLPAESEKKENP